MADKVQSHVDVCNAVAMYVCMIHIHATFSLFKTAHQRGSTALSSASIHQAVVAHTVSVSSCPCNISRTAAHVNLN